jgi:hypothetical protein
MAVDQFAGVCLAAAVTCPAIAAWCLVAPYVRRCVRRHRVHARAAVEAGRVVRALIAAERRAAAEQPEWTP